MKKYTMSLFSLLLCSACGSEGSFDMESFEDGEFEQGDELIDELRTCGSPINASGGMQASTGSAITEGWGLWSNGTLKFSKRMSTERELIVRAKGDFAVGEWPLMEVKMGSKVVATHRVTTSDWKSYSVPLPAGTSGDQTFTLAFTNDARDSSGDRNLRVSSATFACAEQTTTPAPVSATGSHTGAAPAVHMQLKDKDGVVVCSAYNTPADTAPVATGCPSGTYIEQLFDAGWHQIGGNRDVTVGTSTPGGPTIGPDYLKFTATDWLAYDGTPSHTVESGNLLHTGSLDDGSKLALTVDLTKTTHVSLYFKAQQAVLYFQMQDASGQDHWVALSDTLYPGRTEPDGGLLHVTTDLSKGAVVNVDPVAMLKQTKGVDAVKLVELNIRGTGTVGKVHFGKGMELTSRVGQMMTPTPQPTPETYTYPPSVTQVQDNKPALAYPALRTKTSTAISGISITRVTDNTGQETWPTQHQYSRRQAWNSDETRLLLSQNIYDAKTYQKVGYTSMSNHHWSGTDPSLMFGITGSNRDQFAKHHLDTDTIEVLHTFSGYSGCTLGDGEGSVTPDDKLVAINCKGGSGKVLFSFDIAQKKVLGTLNLKGDYNWASFSTLGTYILVENNNGGPREFIRYDPNLRNPMLLTRDIEHGDMGLDDNGDEVYIIISWTYLEVIRLKDGARIHMGVTSKDNLAYYGHLSCRNVKRPGWCYISSNRGFIGAFKLGIASSTPIGTTDIGTPLYQGVSVWEPWGYHRSSRATYQSQPKLSASPSGTKVIVSSDWEGTKPINDFVFEVAQ